MCQKEDFNASDFKFINYLMLFNCCVYYVLNALTLKCIKFITNQHEACTLAKQQLKLSANARKNYN